ncbi:MAG TPA: nitrate reductase [Polyangiaceae bacterium]|nr:nitrate reductase [Polyangiaceae bacterium]
MKTLEQLGRLGRDLLVRRDGPLTRELLLEPGKFGLGRVPARLAPEQTTTMVCGFCSTGCGLNLLLNKGEAVGLVPTTDYPVNLGMACPKGWEALTPLRGPGRATAPLLRKGGKLVEVSWEEALGTMVDRFKGIQEKYGPAAVAWLGTGQAATEELAFLGALGKFGMGMVHGDGNTRQCMATSAVAYKQSFGFDAPPFTYKDFEESDVIVLIGSNLCIAHPIMWERICKNKHNPTLIVVDPRKTETAMAAMHHYAIKPKSDLTLLYAVSNLLIQNGWVDRDYVAAHTQGFDEYAAHVSRFSLEEAATLTGIPVERIELLARMIHEGKRVSLWWTMGVNQSHEGVRTAQAIIAIALMTRNIGRPGTGANSITGQCNAMGSRVFSNTTTLLGGRDFQNAQHRQDVADILGISVQRIPSEPSLAYDQIIEAILSGKIRGLWVIATNPAHSWINQAHLHDVLKRLDCLVVQDMYRDTETAERADIVLPAAGWGEKEGTFINSERRIGTIKRVCRAPGQALADFHIFQLVAEAWGVGELFREWSSPEAVFQIIKRLSRGQPCDITGIEDYAMLDRHGGVQWPLPEGEPLESNERRLFEDGRFFGEGGRAKFLFSDPRPLPEPTTASYPLLLLTGRGSSSQWHTQTRTKRSEVLAKLCPSELYVEISASDARALAIQPDETVHVCSQRATVRARAFITNSVKPGEVFMPMHYETMNQLTFAAFDPYSRQPAYKACAVKIVKVDRVS